MAVDVTLKRKGASAFDILHPKTNSNQIEGLAALLDAITIDSLNDIADVIITNPAAGQGLFRNGDNDAWVNKTLEISDVTNLQEALYGNKNTYIGDWAITTSGQGHDFIFGPMPVETTSVKIRIDQLDLEGNIRIKVNGVIKVAAINGADNTRQWKEFTIGITDFNTLSSNTIRVEHDGGSADWGNIYQIQLIYNKPISNIVGLQDALDAKSDAHTHPYLSDSHAASGVTTTKISNWDNAWSWIDDYSYTTEQTTFIVSEGKADWDAAYTHSQAAHAPVNAITGITKAMVEAVLTGQISTHTHNYLSSYTETDPIFTAWDKSTGISITKSQVSDFPTSMPASDVHAWAKAENKPSYAFSEITGTIDEAQLPVSVFGGLRYVNTQLSNKTTSELMTAINTYLSSKGGTAEGCFFMAGNDITITVSTGHQVNVYMGDEDNIATATETFILHTGDWIIFTRNQGAGLDDIWSVVNNTYPNALTDAYGLVRLSSQTVWANLSGDNVITDAKLKALVESYAPAKATTLAGYGITDAWQAMGSWKPSSLSAMTRVIGLTAESGASNFALATASGKMYAYVDGWFYQNEGAYRVLDTSDVDDTPVNGATTVPISSNWAYDHANSTDAHPGYLKDGEKAADSNLLDGIDSGSFLRSDTTDYGESALYLRFPFPYANGIPSNNLGSPTLQELAMFEEQFNNKTAFYDISKIQFETYNGSTWTDITSTISDANKRALLGGDASSGILIPNGVVKYRITITNVSYVYINALYMYWSGSGNSMKCHTYKSYMDTDVWVQHTSSDQYLSSWPGHWYMPFSTIPWHTGGTEGIHWKKIRFEFTPNWTHATNSISLYKLQLWGGYPAENRHPYMSVDSSKNVDFAGTVEASILYENGGVRVYSPNNKPTASDVGLGNVTNESKATMFTSPTFTGAVTLPDTTLPYGKQLVMGDSNNGAAIAMQVSGENWQLIEKEDANKIWLEFKDDDGLYILGTKAVLTNDSRLSDARTPTAHDHTILKENALIDYGVPGLQWTDVSGLGGTGEDGEEPENPYSDWFHHLIMNHANTGGYYTDIMTCFHSDRIFFKKVANGVQGDIREFYHTGNNPKWVNIASKPTTLSGYGITDGMTATDIATAISTAISDLVDSSPGTLDTLNELAAALGDDPNFATTVTNSIATKLSSAGGTTTGTISMYTSNTTGTYNTRAIELREVGLVATAQSADAYAPAIGFHWGGRYGKKLYMGSDGYLDWDGNKVFHEGYHPNADTLTTPRNISLSGDATGYTTFDGSANVGITVTIVDDSHNHIISNVDGLQTALDGKSSTSHTHTFASLTSKPTTLSGYGITDAMSTSHPANGITSQQISDWGQTTYIVAGGHNEWDDAYSWGDHAGLYRPIAWVPAWADVTGKPSTFVPSSHNNDAHSENYITGITKAMVEAVLTGDITTHDHILPNYAGPPSFTLGKLSRIDTHVYIGTGTTAKTILSNEDFGDFKPDLAAIEALSGTSGFLKKTAANTWTLDTNNYCIIGASSGINKIAYWTGDTTIGGLDTASYPSLTELAYVKGVTSAIQTQLNAKLPLAGGTMSGDIQIGSYKLKVDANSYIQQTGQVVHIYCGGTEVMEIRGDSYHDMKNKKLSNVSTPTSNLDAANKYYVDDAIADYLDTHVAKGGWELLRDRAANANLTATANGTTIGYVTLDTATVGTSNFSYGDVIKIEVLEQASAYGSTGGVAKIIEVVVPYPSDSSPANTLATGAGWISNDASYTYKFSFQISFANNYLGDRVYFDTAFYTRSYSESAETNFTLYVGRIWKLKQ